MKVTFYKSTDGTLHDSYAAYAAHEATLKIAPLVQELVGNIGSESFSLDSRGNDVLYAEGDEDIATKTIAGFIAANADAIRTILNDALVVKRGRKAGSKNVAAAA